MTSALSLDSVCSGQEGGIRLTDVSLSLEPGTICFFTDENAGELRLLFRLLTAEYSPSSGRISYLSHEYVPNSQWISDDLTFPLFEAFTTAENIYFSTDEYGGKTWKSVDRLAIEKRCGELFSRFGIASDPSRTIRHMSLAQQQLIMLLRAYVSPCKTLLLSEPTALLTPSESVIAYRILKAMRDQGRCILIASTKIAEIIKYGDALFHFHEGRLVQQLERGDGFDTEEIYRLFNSTCFLNRYPRRTHALGSPCFKVSGLSAYNVLKDVSFELHRGEILGVTGLAGSGRSILCRSLFGLTDCQVRQMRINGRPVKIATPFDAIEQGIAYLSENSYAQGIFENFDISSNLSIASFSRFTDHRFILNTACERQLVGDFMRQLDLDCAAADKPIQLLDRGQQQKLLLCRWILSGAQFYMLDEPTHGLDIPTRIDLYNMMEELIGKGCSILLVSSDIEELLGMCDRLLVIADGKIVLNEPTCQLNKERIWECIA